MNTSPLYGMGHGYYVFSLPDGTELYQYLPQCHFAAYSEFGVPGPSPVTVLEKIIPPEELFPPRRSPAWIARHAYDAWDGSSGSWLEDDFLRRYFGTFRDLEDLVECGQFVQAEGLRFFFEETRRQKPYCSLAMNWCLNDSWPTAANSSLIAWPAQPKPALEKVKQACRPVLASARPGKLRWQPGEIFTADLTMLNDSIEPLSAGSMEAVLIADGRETVLLRWEFPAAAENINIPGPQLRVELPQMQNRRFELALRVAGKPEWDSVYSFILSHTAWQVTGLMGQSVPQMPPD
jgi:beta-mannosidase